MPTQDFTNQQNMKQPVLKDPDFSESDPNEDIDLSHMEGIIDTSSGETINFNSSMYSRIYSFSCKDCNFRYEGHQVLEVCPRCGSGNIDDSK